MTRHLKRLVCRIRGHRWKPLCLGTQRVCERCGAWDWADLLRGGWWRVRA